MPRASLTTAVALTLAALAPAAAVAQAPAPTTPTTPTAPTAPAGPPALDSLRMPKIVTAQQGHARFLVGVRLATASKLTVQVLKASDGTVVQTSTDTTARAAGRAYLRVEAIDSQGFQLLKGAYRLRIQATDDQSRVSRPVEAAFTLRLTAPRGQFTGYTIPVWRAFSRQAGTSSGGQLITVVGPKTSAATAGLRRGDVITAINGAQVTSPGAWATAMRALPADTTITVDLIRKGAPLTLPLKPGPDWEAAPDYQKSFAVAVRREPRVLAYRVAQVRHLVETGKIAEARALVAGWPRALRTSAPGHLVQGEIEARRGRWKQALGAYNRARKADPTMAAAEFGRGVALSELDKTGPSAVAFAAAGRLDPTDAAAAGFRAYALLQADRTTEGITEAQRAVRLDPRYADGFLPLGIGLLTAGDKPGGVRMLRRGLILLEEPDRASRLIAQHLDPTDP
ncbi:MAG: PDZ domain-containing protein [Thermoleophilia bacterium]